MKKILVLLALIFVLSSLFALNCFADTQTIELSTRSILLVDCSGSMQEQEAVNKLLAQIDVSKYDEIVYFDHRGVQTDESFIGGGNSHICEAIDQVAKSGFTYICLLSDCSQYPEDYSALGVYTDLNVQIYMPGEPSDKSDRFIKEFESRISNSTLKVGDEVIVDNYQPPIYVIDMPNSESKAEESKVEKEEHECKCKWLLALILAVLIAALFDFIHELLTRNRNSIVNNEKEVSTEAKTKLASGKYKLLADVSGSMADYQMQLVKVCKRSRIPEVLTLGETVRVRKTKFIWNITPQGRTKGWEAIEKASQKGWKNLFIVTDLMFNEKTFEQVKVNKFDNIVLVLPNMYDIINLEKIRSITNNLEIIQL